MIFSLLQRRECELEKLFYHKSYFRQRDNIRAELMGIRAGLLHLQMFVNFLRGNPKNPLSRHWYPLLEARFFQHSEDAQVWLSDPYNRLLLRKGCLEILEAEKIISERVARRGIIDPGVFVHVN